MELKPKIGLEVHIELDTESKMFCSCPNQPFESKPNLNICPICLGHPGTLPSANKSAIEKVVKLGIALNCKVSEESYFERKNYFYPDLPKGYQISQYQIPLCKEGFLEIPGISKKIRIKRVHLEEDTAKIYHTKDFKFALIDFNRAGTPLAELVTEPDFDSAKEARLFAQELQLVLRYLKVSKADMEKGEMRIEANVSISKIEGDKEILGTKVEVKNLNSFAILEKAIDYEIQRQLKLIEAGKEVVQETRGWDERLKKTLSQRTKEEEKDYRYFPEPDLTKVLIAKDWVERLKKELPELPWKLRERLIQEYGLSFKETEILVKDLELERYFEKCTSEAFQRYKEDFQLSELSEDIKLKLAKNLFNLLTSELIGRLREKNLKISNLKFSPENFAELSLMLFKKEISSKIVKLVLEKMIEKGGDPSQIVKEESLTLMKEEELDHIIQKVIQENPQAIKDYSQGRKEALQYLIGQVMRYTKGKADPQSAKSKLLAYLEK